MSETDSGKMKWMVKKKMPEQQTLIATSGSRHCHEKATQLLYEIVEKRVDFLSLHKFT